MSNSQPPTAAGTEPTLDAALPECPPHDCEFISNPEKGACRFHEEWARRVSLNDDEYQVDEHNAKLMAAIARANGFSSIAEGVEELWSRLGAVSRLRDDLAAMERRAISAESDWQQSESELVASRAALQSAQDRIARAIAEGANGERLAAMACEFAASGSPGAVSPAAPKCDWKPRDKGDSRMRVPDGFAPCSRCGTPYPSSFASGDFDKPCVGAPAAPDESGDTK